MKKLLFSWIAFNNDFKDGKVDKENSPNYQYHHEFYDHDIHYILSSAESDDTRAHHLKSAITNDFTNHKVEIVYMGITNVISLPEIKTKIEKLLLEHRNEDIDIFFSPGTSIMQLSWFICHTTLGLKTKLFQTKPGRFSKSGIPELLEIKIGQSEIPVSTTIKDIVASERDKGQVDDYLITDGIGAIYEKAELIAQTDNVSVLINGKSGTGKEHLAKYIHKQSVRKDKAFITINCSAFQDSLLESRLFGYKKGAFTGAAKDTFGLFEEANHGTIFLDEIGDISPYMQQSLLRVLQEKEIQPVGGIPKSVDVRVIAATNRDLIQLCNEEKFRWDLYYRLAVVELELPTLMERGQNDVKELIEFFIRKKKQVLKKNKKLTISAKLHDFLLSYPYPGNVRELENMIENLYVIFNGKTVDISDLPKRFNQLPVSESLKWKDVEKQLIIKVLELKNGNKSQANQALGYGSINTLNDKIRKYDIRY